MKKHIFGLIALVIFAAFLANACTKGVKEAAGLQDTVYDENDTAGDGNKTNDIMENQTVNENMSEPEYVPAQDQSVQPSVPSETPESEPNQMPNDGY